MRLFKRHPIFPVINLQNSCKCLTKVHVPNFVGLSGSEDRGGGDNSIQFINFGRMTKVLMNGDKN